MPTAAPPPAACWACCGRTGRPPFSCWPPTIASPLDHITLSAADAFATPLGRVAVDRRLVDELAGCPDFRVDGAAHRQEHAVEIVLPLLQRAWGEGDAQTPPWRLVPMLVPHLDAPRLLAAGQALGRVRDAGPGPVLILVSSDFTHHGSGFGYTPFAHLPATDLPQALETLDSGAILRILAGDPRGLLEYGRETGITMCGLPAAAVALAAGLPAGYEAGLVDYCRSGDQNGDYGHSVSYASILFTTGRDQGESP